MLIEPRVPADAGILRAEPLAPSTLEQLLELLSADAGILSAVSGTRFNDCHGAALSSSTL
jgi:hypothetical protein